MNDYCRVILVHTQYWTKNRIIILLFLLFICIPSCSCTIIPDNTSDTAGYHQELEKILASSDISTAYLLVLSNNTLISAEGYGKTTPAEILGFDDKTEYKVASEILLMKNQLKYLPSQVKELVTEHGKSRQGMVNTTGSLSLNHLPSEFLNYGITRVGNDACDNCPSEESSLIQKTIMQIAAQSEASTIQSISLDDSSWISEFPESSHDIISLSQPTTFSYRGHTVTDQSIVTPAFRVLITYVPDKDLIIAVLVSEQITPLPESIRGKILNMMVNSGS